MPAGYILFIFLSFGGDENAIQFEKNVNKREREAERRKDKFEVIPKRNKTKWNSLKSIKERKEKRTSPRRMSLHFNLRL